MSDSTSMLKDHSDVPLVSACGIRMTFGGVEVVKGVDLELRPGEVHAIVGENGAGKSTMAKIIAGVHRPTGGSIELSGKPTIIDNPRHAIHLGIALIHQEPLTFPDLEVAENIFVGHQPIRNKLSGVDWTAMRAKATAILNSIGVKFSARDRVGGLSVADQQMVELACALSHDAQVLIMDETTAALTPKEVDELFTIVRRLRDEGRAIAIVSHHLDEVFAIADRITIMRDGEKVGERLPSETSVDEIIRLMVGRQISEHSHRRQRTATETLPEPILRIRNLTLPGLFEDISFDLRPGQVVGLGGLVGAGRTDVCRALFGVAPATAGTIEIGGKTVRIKSPRQALQHGLALVPEDRQHEGLLMPMSISQNASLPALKRFARFGWISGKAERSLAAEFAEKLNTVCRSLFQPVRELSGGNQQKVVLAKWLMTDPRILILDEPTRGVDVGAKSEVHRLIEELVEQGLAILIVSSDLPELLKLSDQVLVMRQGKLMASFDRDQATPEGVMQAATGQQVAYAV